MTCICGIVDVHGQIWIGGDSAGSDQYTVLTSTLSKVFRKEQMLLGIAGSWRQMQLVHYALELPEHPRRMSDEAYLTTLFIDAIRECFTSAGSTSKFNEQESTSSAFLIGYHQKLYRIHSDYGITTSDCQYDAVGSGDDIARGALFATPHLSPQDRLRMALKAAVEHTPYVRPPFTIEMLSPPTDFEPSSAERISFLPKQTNTLLTYMMHAPPETSVHLAPNNGNVPLDHSSTFTGAGHERQQEH